MKLNQRKENKYAFNINSRKNKNRKIISFKTLTGNFYDDLLNSDMNIKRNKKELSDIKNRTIKESIYCNKNIPKSWKTLLSYKNEVYKAIDQDSNFAYYIGSSNKENKINEFFGTGLKNINTTEKNEKFINIDNIDKYIKDNYKEDELIENNNNIRRKESKTLSYFDNKKDKNKIKTVYHFGLKDNYLDDKFISSKLDEYRSKYDIDKFIGNIKHEIGNIKIEKDYMIQPKLTIQTKSNYREFLKDKTQNNKENVLKKTIFSNLIPEKGRNKFYNTIFNYNKKESLPKLKRAPRYIHFNTATSFFKKENESGNPSITKKIMRDLELINYFGPHYSNCYVCNKRNMEFYGNSEPNQTLVLLNYLKKTKLNDKKGK